MTDRPMRVAQWDSVDDTVQDHVLRVRALDARSRRASDDARQASEAVAAVVRDDEKRRSDAMASGEDDPGRDQRKIAAAERKAEAASEAARLTAAALTEAQRRLEVVCAERAEEWQAIARGQLDDAAGDLSDAVEALRRAYLAWVVAGAQVALASDERERRRGRARVVDLAVEIPGDATVTKVLDALAQLVTGGSSRTTHEPVAVE